MCSVTTYAMHFGCASFISTQQAFTTVFQCSSYHRHLNVHSGLPWMCVCVCVRFRFVLLAFRMEMCAKGREIEKMEYNSKQHIWLIFCRALGF